MMWGLKTGGLFSSIYKREVDSQCPTLTFSAEGLFYIKTEPERICAGDIRYRGRLRSSESFATK